MTKQLILSSGRVIAYREWGRPDGSVVLVLHGLTADGASWELVGPLLGERFRVVAPDLAGHGDSDWAPAYSIAGWRDDALEFMDGVGAVAAVVVGHSIGGTVAYLLAATHPDRVRALVLEDPAPPVPAEPPRPIPAGPEPGQPYDWRAVVTAHQWRNDPPRAWWDYAGQIRCRTLIVGGEKSHLPQDTLAELARRIPRGRFASLPTGHDVHGERPGEFAALLMPFLAEAIR